MQIEIKKNSWIRSDLIKYQRKRVQFQRRNSKKNLQKKWMKMKLAEKILRKCGKLQKKKSKPKIIEELPTHPHTHTRTTTNICCFSECAVEAMAPIHTENSLDCLISGGALTHTQTYTHNMRDTHTIEITDLSINCHRLHWRRVAVWASGCWKTMGNGEQCLGTSLMPTI